MNGKRGVSIDYHFNPDMSKKRYTLQLDSGEAFKVKPANVRAEGTGGGAVAEVDTNKRATEAARALTGMAVVELAFHFLDGPCPPRLGRVPPLA